MPPITPPSPELRDAYLDLVEGALLGRFAPRRELVPRPGSTKPRQAVDALFRRYGLEAGAWVSDEYDGPNAGALWLRHGTTMIGPKRLRNIRACVEDVIRNNVTGDLIETGVWRGGATIYMRAVLKAWGVTDRTVWVADSFEGMPKPDLERYPIDGTADPWHENNDLFGVSLDQVQSNFARFDLLDSQVSFLKGWFKDTLPRMTDHRWSVVRLDGDLYESTLQALTYLYPQLSPGGWLIVDDYWIPVCKQAVTDFREEHGITETIQEIDEQGVCWQRAAA